MIAINAVLLDPYRGGIGTYMTNLFQQFETMLPQNALKIYFSSDYYDYYKDKFTFPSVQTPLSSTNPFKRVLIENLYWNQQLKRDGIKLFHSPISYLPFNLKMNSIVTIHDMRVFCFPDTYPKMRMVFLKKAIRYSILKSTKIITISNFTKNEILRLTKISPEKIDVIYEGVNLKHFQLPQQPSDQTVLEKYKIKNRYILTVGHLEPRKNFLRLIQAFELLQKYADTKLQLIIGGKENYYYNSLYEYVKSKNLEDVVVFTGFIQDTHLPVLYRNAEIFVFPSIYEGFGFPPLESMASGVAVAASNISAIPEIVGDAAIYFDPYSVEDIAKKVLELLQNKGLRIKLMENSKKALERYNWYTCAKQVINTYQSVIEEKII